MGNPCSYYDFGKTLTITGGTGAGQKFKIVRCDVGKRIIQIQGNFKAPLDASSIFMITED